LLQKKTRIRTIDWREVGKAAPKSLSQLQRFINDPLALFVIAKFRIALHISW
jgi:hypothetical protein